MQVERAVIGIKQSKYNAQVQMKEVDQVSSNLPMMSSCTVVRMLFVAFAPAFIILESLGGSICDVKNAGHAK